MQALTHMVSTALAVCLAGIKFVVSGTVNILCAHDAALVSAGRTCFFSSRELLKAACVRVDAAAERCAAKLPGAPRSLVRRGEPAAPPRSPFGFDTVLGPMWAAQIYGKADVILMSASCSFSSIEHMRQAIFNQNKMRASCQ